MACVYPDGSLTAHSLRFEEIEKRRSGGSDGGDGRGDNLGRDGRRNCGRGDGKKYIDSFLRAYAGAVLEYCTGENNAGLDSGQTEAFREISSAVGHSFDEPVYGSDGKIDMAASRRVEIRFFLNLGE